MAGGSPAWVDGSADVPTAQRNRIQVQITRIRKILGPELRRAIHTGSNPPGYGVSSRLSASGIHWEGTDETCGRAPESQLEPSKSNVDELDESASLQQPAELSGSQNGSSFGITIGALLQLVENGRVKSTDRVILGSELDSFRRFASEEATETPSVWLANSRIEIQPDRQLVFTYDTAFPPGRTELALTETEYKIFAFLSEHREPVESGVLIEYLWPDSGMPYKNLYTNLCKHIKRIRDKLPEDLRRVLKNRNRRGYYFSG